jgi:hypothetical protein
MSKRTIPFLLPAVLLAVSGSIARADNFSIVSNWQIGSAQFGNLNSFTGNGTFTYNGSSFSNIVFSFTGTFPPTATTPNWTATPTDGELLNGNTFLILGDGPFDCSGPSCVGILFATPITTGGPLMLTAIGGFSQNPNTVFDSATLTDTSFASNGQGTVPEPGSVLLLLTVLGTVGMLGGRKLRRTH